MRLAIFTEQISHYHAARFRAAAAVAPDVMVISRSTSALSPELAAPGRCEFPILGLFESPADYRAAQAGDGVWRRVFGALKAVRPDVIAVSGWANQESFAAIGWAKANRARLVVMSDSQHHDADRAQWREFIKSRVAQAYDAALVAGPTHREYLAQLGLPRERIFLGYDVVDNAYFAEGADRARAGESGLSVALPRQYLLASARFIPKKNLPLLVRAYAAALARVDAASTPDLVILGDGEERPAIERAIAAANLVGRVHLIGRHGYGALPHIYGMAEAFVHVSLSEQWGLVINEAAASGLPLIVSRPCGAAATLVGPENGFLVDPQHEADVADALVQMLRMPAEQRRQMGAESRKRVADWGPARYAQGLSAAAEAARARPTRGLAWPDRALLSVLARRTIEAVA